MSFLRSGSELLEAENEKEKEVWCKRVAEGKKRRGVFGDDRIELNLTPLKSDEP